MVEWPDFQGARETIDRAIKFLNDHQVGQALIASTLSSIPLVGPFLQELYDRNAGSGQPANQDISQFLEALSSQSEARFEEIGRLTQNNKDAVIGAVTSGNLVLMELITKGNSEVQRKLDAISSQLIALAQRQKEDSDRIAVLTGLTAANALEHAVFEELLAALRRLPPSVSPMPGIFVGSAPIRAVPSGSGETVYVSNLGSDSVSSIDTATRKVTSKFEVGRQPGSLALDRDGKVLYVGNNGGGVSAVDLGNGAVRAVLKGHTVRDMVMGPEGKLYLALEYEGLGELDTERQELRIVSPVPCPEGVALTPDDHRLYVSYQCHGPGGHGYDAHDSIGVYDVRSGEWLEPIEGLPNVGGAIAVSPDGLQVWINGSDACSRPDYPHEGCPFLPSAVINVIDAQTNRPLKTIGIPVEYGAGIISFAETEQEVMAIVGGPTLKMFDMKTFRMSQVINIPLSGSVAPSGDGRILFAPAPTQNQVVPLEVVSER
jgi:YVTN family beta-propeller protein